MSLAPHEQRILDRIESSLRRTDPALATMLATFGPPGSRRLHRPQWRGRRVSTGVITASLLVPLVALIFWGLLATPGRLQRCPSPGHEGRSPGAVVACAPAHGTQPPGAASSIGLAPGR